MEDEKRIVVQEDPPILFTGGLIFFIVFALLFYFVNGGNYIYAFCLAFLPVGLLAGLAENKPARSIGYLAGFIVSCMLPAVCRALSSRLLNVFHDGSAGNILQRLSSVTVSGSGVSVLQALLFVAGIIIVTQICVRISEQLPEKFKMPADLHQVMLFLVRIFRLLICAVVVNVVVYKILQKLSYPPGYAFLIYIIPVCFLCKTWKQTVKDVEKQNGKADGKESKLEKIVIPDVKLSDVAGMEEVKEQIRVRMIMPIRDPKGAARYGILPGGGMLLYGPPGTGKTFFARAVAGELNIPFYAITAADIFSKYVGESENNIRAVFREIRENKLSVLFIDELESIFRARDADIHETTRKVISILLQELDGIQSSSGNMLLIGATNAPHLVDEAFLRTGRLDVQIFVGLPDAAARQQILEACFKDVDYPIQKGLLKGVAKYTADYSGADLKGLAAKVKQLAFIKKVKCYEQELFEECLGNFHPSPNGHILQQIKEWECRRQS